MSTSRSLGLAGRGPHCAHRGDDSIAKAVAALPFTGNKVGAGVVSLPRLSIQEYASLHAELAVWPERSGEILRRHHVMNEAARRALAEHWQAELAASPEARAMFEKDLADYTAWMRVSSSKWITTSPGSLATEHFSDVSHAQARSQSVVPALSHSVSAPTPPVPPVPPVSPPPPPLLEALPASVGSGSPEHARTIRETTERTR